MSQDEDNPCRAMCFLISFTSHRPGISLHTLFGTSILTPCFAGLVGLRAASQPRCDYRLYVLRRNELGGFP